MMLTITESRKEMEEMLSLVSEAFEGYLQCTHKNLNGRSGYAMRLYTAMESLNKELLTSFDALSDSKVLEWAHSVRHTRAVAKMATLKALLK